MRTETIEITYYKFDELSEGAKQHAIEKLSDINTDSEWYDTTIDDAKEIGKILGINIDKVYFSGFSSQGDGACFEGNYTYVKNSVKNIKEYAPKDERLHVIAKDLQRIQRKAFYKLNAQVKHSGHYYHENCTIIDVEKNDYTDASNDQIDGVKEALRDFMRWIYKTLESEYEYLSGKEAILETIQANDYEFDVNGNLQ